MACPKNLELEPRSQPVVSLADNQPWIEANGRSDGALTRDLLGDSIVFRSVELARIVVKSSATLALVSGRDSCGGCHVGRSKNVVSIAEKDG